MTTLSYQTSARAYQDAIGALYAQPTGALAERGEGDIIMVPDLEDRAQAVIDRSRELGQTLPQLQQSGDADRRELAELQLVAAAALDLQVANDLVRRAENGVPEEVRERAAVLPSAFRELHAVLNADLNKGIGGLIPDLSERGGGSSNPQAARQALLAAVDGTLESIRDDAAIIGQAATNNLVNLPAAEISKAASVVLSQVMNQLSENVSALIRKGVSLVALAIDKILQALGKQAQDTARKKAAEWIEDLRGGTLFGMFLDKLYEPERIKQEVVEVINSVPADATRFNAATEGVAQIAEKFRMQKDVLTWLLRSMSFVQPWIMPLTPWGPLGLVAGYVAVTGYIVYLAGDYCDWYRVGSERLDLVLGVRMVVRAKITAV